MTGYRSKRDMAQDKLAQPAQEPNWVCNECGAQEFTAALSEADLDYLACSNCGGNEFHKEALAQPVQEPVAWMYDWLCDGKLITGWIAHSESEIPKSMAFNIRPLYTAPPQPAQDPVYSDIVSDGGLDPRNKFDAQPPQRPWVGLTDEERKPLIQQAMMYYGYNKEYWLQTSGAGFCLLVQAIEAKLKEKNNGT